MGPDDKSNQGAKDAGSGDIALVFQHHWGGSSLTWNEVISRLRDRFRCVAIDARGAGASQAPADGYGTVDHEQDVLNVLGSLDIRRYILVAAIVEQFAATL